MPLARDDRDGVAVFVLDGSLDAAAAPGIEGALMDAIDGGARRVLVDLSGVPFVDSSGLSVLIRAFEKTREHGGRLAVAGVRESVKPVLRLTRLDRVLEVMDDPARAVETLAQSGQAQSGQA